MYQNYSWFSLETANVEGLCSGCVYLSTAPTYISIKSIENCGCTIVPVYLLREIGVAQESGEETKTFFATSHQSVGVFRPWGLRLLGNFRTGCEESTEGWWEAAQKVKQTIMEMLRRGLVRRVRQGRSANRVVIVLSAVDHKFKLRSLPRSLLPCVIGSPNC
jgi:hypothetical protein